MNNSRNIKFDKLQVEGIEIKRCLNSQQAYKEHLHEELSIGYIEKGSTVLGYNGDNYKYSQGEGIIVPPFVSHICRPKDVKNWQVFMMYINMDVISKYINVSKELELRKLTKEELIKYNELIEEINKDLSLFKIENLLIELIVLCLDSDENINSNIKNTSPRTDITEQIHKYMKLNYKNKISLNQLESIFNLNKYSIIRNFKSLYNTTPSAFQLQLKVAYSKSLLGEGIGLLDVCNEAGFYDQAHFTREFRKLNGVTPLQYQKDVVN